MTTAKRWSANASTSRSSHVLERIAFTGMTDLTIMLGNRWSLNVATQVVGGVRTLTANHDLTIVNAGATGFSKDPVAFVLLVEQRLS